MTAQELPANSPYARFYDFFAGFDHDLAFYEELANVRGGPVLELGCGTGRVALALARRGIPVVGVEISREMLAIAREKAIAAKVDPRQIEWVEGDLTRIDLGRVFPLVVCVANTLLCLRTRTAQELACHVAARHMERGGRFALDVVSPWVYLRDHPADGTIRVVKEGTDSRSGLAARWTAAVRHSGSAQILLAANEISLHAPDGTVERHVFEETMRYVQRGELELLLEKAALEVEAIHGWFDCRPFDDTARKMVVVARRAVGG